MRRSRWGKNRWRWESLWLVLRKPQWMNWVNHSVCLMGPHLGGRQVSGLIERTAVSLAHVNHPTAAAVVDGQGNGPLTRGWFVGPKDQSMDEWEGRSQG